MFLIERIVSLLVFSLLLFFTMIMISIINSNKYKIILVLYLFALAILAYFFIPDITMDLYRLHRECFYGVGPFDWNNTLFLMKRSMTPMWIFFEWIIFQLFNDVNFIQTFSWLLGGASIFYLISHTIDYNNIKHSNRALMLFFIMSISSFYMGFIGGIRNMLSFAIIAFCIYRESIENKIILWNIPFYLFAAFLHQAGLALILIYIFVLATKFKNIIFKLSVFIFSIITLILLINSNSSFIDSIFNKAYNYSNNLEEYVYFWEMLIGFLLQIEACIILFVYGKVNYKQSYKFTTIAWLSRISLLISFLGLPFSFAIFRRFASASILFSIPLCGLIISNYKNKKIFIYTLWIISFVVFLLSIIRGNMCGYKFFIL